MLVCWESFYCHDQGRTFEEVYSDIIQNDQWLKEFARLTRPGGLGLSDQEALNLSVVCRQILR